MLVYQIGAGSPTAVPVFDMALFISMSNECGKLLALHERYRQLEGEGKRHAHRSFVDAVLKAKYRFGLGRCGFSLLCTFALLTGIRSYVACARARSTAPHSLKS